MTPFRQFSNGVRQAREDVNEMLDELTAFAEVMAHKQNSVDMDENGYFYVTAAGPLEEVIATMGKQLEKLQRIKKQKDEDIDRKSL